MKSLIIFQEIALSITFIISWILMKTISDVLKFNLKSLILIKKTPIKIYSDNIATLLYYTWGSTFYIVRTFKNSR